MFWPLTMNLRLQIRLWVCLILVRKTCTMYIETIALVKWCSDEKIDSIKIFFFLIQKRLNCKLFMIKMYYILMYVLIYVLHCFKILENILFVICIFIFLFIKLFLKNSSYFLKIIFIFLTIFLNISIYLSIERIQSLFKFNSSFNILWFTRCATKNWTWNYIQKHTVYKNDWKICYVLTMKNEFVHRVIGNLNCQTDDTTIQLFLPQIPNDRFFFLYFFFNFFLFPCCYGYI